MPNTPSRFPNGVTNTTEDGAFGDYLLPRKSTYVEYFDDFLKYTATDWVVSESDSGSTQTIVASGDAGLLALTNVSAGATDACSLQWSNDGGTTVGLQWAWTAPKDQFISFRFKVSDSTNAALLLGLASTDTAPVASLPTDGIYFYKAAAGTTLIGSTRKAGTSTSATLSTAIASDTFYSVVMFYTAVDKTWRLYLNNVMQHSFIDASTTPTAALAVTIALLNGSAAAHVLTVDRAWVGRQR